MGVDTSSLTPTTVQIINVFAASKYIISISPIVFNIWKGAEKFLVWPRRNFKKHSDVWLFG